MSSKEDQVSDQLEGQAATQPESQAATEPIEETRQDRRVLRRGVWMLAAAAATVTAVLLMDRSSFNNWSTQLRVLTELSPPAPAKRDTIGPDWVAAAPGKVEPVSGEIKLGPLELGRVAEILVAVGDRVGKGDLLVRLEDDEARARVVAAEAQVVSRRRERDDAPPAETVGDRRRTEDNVAAAERELAAARQRVDRLSGAGSSSPVGEAALADARRAVARARDQVRRERTVLAQNKAANDKAPSRLDNTLAVASAELTLAEALFEKTRIRAPLAATVLQLSVRIGETVAPLPERPLIVLADVSKLRVRADLDERNAAKVHIGQVVRVRSDTFPDRDFIGKVVAIAPALAPGQTATPGRRRPNDRSVLDISVDLTAETQLLPGMHVDVFFLAPEPTVNATAP